MRLVGSGMAESVAATANGFVVPGLGVDPVMVIVAVLSSVKPDAIGGPTDRLFDGEYAWISVPVDVDVRVGVLVALNELLLVSELPATMPAKMAVCALLSVPGSGETGFV